MFGVLVPRNMEQALEIDAANGNTKWADAADVELAMIDSYDTFADKGKGYTPSPDYKKIKVHIIFACKHDGRRKARLVAGGHLRIHLLIPSTPVSFPFVEYASSPSLQNSMEWNHGPQILATHIWNHIHKKRCTSLLDRSLVTERDTLLL